MLQTDAPPAVTTPPVLPHNRFSIVEPDSFQRAALEARVRTGFGVHFGACIEGFMPALAQYEHISGGKGVIGLRSAASESLFLETYLDVPIEKALARLSGSAVSRDRVAEVGQFVVDGRDLVSDFFRDMLPFLGEQGFEWVCFTGTGRIRRLVARLGFVLAPLAAAEHGRLQGGSNHWGSYYEHEPVVVAGKVSDPFGGWCAAGLAGSG